MASNHHFLVTALRDLTETSDYDRGVLDTLRLLGLVTLENGLATPTGEVAQMLVASLAAHAEEGTEVGFDWNELDGEGLRGVDLVRAFEESRAQRNSGAGAERSVHVVQAIIKGMRENLDYYLMQYDPHAKQYQPIGGKVEASDADSEAALCREIEEELEFDAPPGIEDCTMELIEAGWVTSKISPTYGVLTNYVFDFYHLTQITFPISQTGYTRWLRRGEIERGRADDSRSVSTIYLEALGMARLDALPVGVKIGQ
jgi:8-oxo-dGTP pyrophosphatase MutT (NUDIX family)